MHGSLKITNLLRNIYQGESEPLTLITSVDVSHIP